jgi:hypothetical protein
LRHLFTALDIAGVILASGGLIGLAWGVSPFLSALAAGLCCLAVVFAWEPRRRGEK